MPESVATMEFTRRKPNHVHPRLVRTLDGNAFFPMTCTFQVQDNDRTPAGGFKKDGGWTDVPSLTDIPCRRGVPQSSERQANERPTGTGPIDIESFVIVLNGYYPEVRADMRAVISDGAIIDIKGVNTDSDLEVTTATGRIVTPGAQPIRVP